MMCCVSPRRAFASATRSGQLTLLVFLVTANSRRITSPHFALPSWTLCDLRPDTASSIIVLDFNASEIGSSSQICA
jgi:hypothetical protein